MAKKLKRANGTGCIIKESGRRRNPYRASVTLGWDDNGKQILMCYTERAVDKHPKIW